MLNSKSQQFTKIIKETQQFLDYELQQGWESPVNRIEVFQSVYQDLQHILESIKPHVSKGLVICDEKTIAETLRNTLLGREALAKTYSFHLLDFEEDPSNTEVIIWMINSENENYIRSHMNEVIELLCQQIDLNLVSCFFLIKNDLTNNNISSDNFQKVSSQITQYWSMSDIHFNFEFLPLNLQKDLNLLKQGELSGNDNAHCPVEIESNCPSLRAKLTDRRRLHSKRGAREGKSIDQLAKSLEALHREYAETRIWQLAMKNTLSQIEKIKNILDQEESSLTANINLEESKIQSSESLTIQQRTNREFKKSEQILNQFYQDSREEISNLKAILMDGYDTRSLKLEIQNLINSLQYSSTVMKKGKIRLEMELCDGMDIHELIIKLTGDWLSYWYKRLWMRLLNNPKYGGIEAITLQIQRRLAIIPQLIPEHEIKLDFKLNSDLKTAKLFNADCKPTFEWSRIYKFPQIFSFLIKDLRTNLMAVAGFILIFSYILPLFSLGQEGASSGFWDKNLLKGIAIAAFFPFALSSSVQAFFEAKEEKQVAILDKIRQEGIKHYQTIASTYVNKFTALASKQLDESEKETANQLEGIKLSYINAINEVERKISSFRNEVKKVKDSQAKLKKIYQALQVNSL